MPVKEKRVEKTKEVTQHNLRMRLLAELEFAIERDDARAIKEARKALQKAGFSDESAA